MLYILEKLKKKFQFQEINPTGDFQGCLDNPKNSESNINGTLLISGWLFNRKSSVKSLILVRKNFLEEQINYGLRRPDVSHDYPDVQSAELSGFKWNLLLDTNYSGKVNIKIFAIIETGEKVCCFARRIQITAYVPDTQTKTNLYLFIKIVIIKTLKFYQQGRLPLSPALWIYYLRRYYRQVQDAQGTGVESLAVIHPWQMQDPYQRWVQKNVLTSKLVKQMEEDAKKLKSQGVKISIVVPVYNTDLQFLQEMIASVKTQIYPNWELCLADDASTKPYIKEVLKQAISEDSRIKVVFRQENGHIVEATNSGLDIATGEYVALLDHDDTLSLDALLHVAECVSKHPDVDWIYTDEDKIDKDGDRFDPQMKGAWSPEMGITHNFTHHLTVIRKTLIDQVGGMRKGFEGAQDLDLFLRVTEKTTPDRIQHISHICYHWRTHPESTASHGAQKEYIFDSAYRAIEETIQRRSLRAKAFLPTIAKQHSLCLYQLKWDASLLAENPVTIIIPTKDKAELLEKCISSLQKTVDPRFVQLIIVDDCSSELITHNYLKKLEENKSFKCRVIHPKREENSFNYSRLMNSAIDYVETPYILHLNNDIEAVEPGWLEDMVGWMSINGVGVVGAKLLYPNETVQHSGVVVGPHNGLADHQFHHLHKQEVGYICLPHAARNVSAVTGACLLTSTNLYKELGGFDQNKFAVEYNDVDYCLRVLELGKRIVYTPQAILIHQTSASRGSDYNPNEHINFVQKYRDFHDRFFNENLNIDSMTMAVNPYKFSYLDRVTQAKVLFVSHNLNLEGAPLILYNYARYFVTNNCKVYVISPLDGILRQEYEQLNIHVEIIEKPLPRCKENIQEFHKQLSKLGEEIHIDSFDVVVCNTLLTYWGVELAKIFNLPSIWHIHESKDIKNSIDHFFGDASVEMMRQILPDCFSNASRVIFQADATRRIFHQFDVRGNFQTIPGAIDLLGIKQFRDSHSKSQLRAKYGVDQNDVVISIIGTTCQRKGQHIFVEAIKQLQTICSTNYKNISCLIVGARESEYLQLLENQIQKLLLENISIYTETKDVYDFYTITDIFVCASFEESFPRVILEAMAFELKIVSTDVFGIPEIISGGEAYLVSPGNPKVLAAAINRCLQEPELSSRLARNAYAKLIRLFDNQTLLRKHLFLMKEVVLSKKAH